MYFNVIKYFLLFVLLTLFSHAGGNTDKASEEEEIKDTIVVHGMVLHGRVMRLGPEKLSFRLLYSTGMSHIAYKDIDSIHTKYNYHISFNRMDIDGRIVGIEDSKYLKVMEGDKQRTIKIADIDNFVMSLSHDDSFENRVRNKFPYTKGNINIGFEIESGSSTKNEVDILLNLIHKQAEHEIRLRVDYEFDTTKTDNTEKVQNKDEPRHVQNRFVPSVGYGYRFKFGKSKWLEPAIGIGYATTSYIDTEETFPDDDFAVAALALKGKYQLDDLAYIDTLITEGFLMYYPSLEDMGEDWVSRANLTFSIPLFDFLALRLAVDWINVSNPDPSIGNNKTTTKMLFGFDF